MADPLALLGAMVLDNGRRWGELATVMQRENAEAVLAPGDPRLHWCEWPKGHSKSTDAGCLSAVWLLEQADELAEGYVVSSDEDQSNRLLDRARGVIRRTGLESVLRVEAKRISNVRTGARDRVVVDRQQVWAGTKAAPVNLTVVEEWLRQMHRDYGGPVVADPYQAVHLAQRLRASAIRVEEFAFSSQSVGRLAVTLFRLIRARQLLLPADDALVDELVNARLRETAPGVFRIDHDASAHDDRVISLALAAHRLVSRPTGQGYFGGREMTRSVLPEILDENSIRVASRDAFNPWRNLSPSIIGNNASKLASSW